MHLLFDPSRVNAHVRVHAGHGRGAAADPPRHQADHVRDGIAFAHQWRTAVALRGEKKNRHIIYGRHRSGRVYDTRVTNRSSLRRLIVFRGLNARTAGNAFQNAPRFYCRCDEWTRRKRISNVNESFREKSNFGETRNCSVTGDVQKVRSQGSCMT